MSVLERYLNLYIDTLWREGGRYAKIKSLSLSLELVDSCRKIALVYFFVFASTMVLTGSCFILLAYGMSAHFEWNRTPIDGYTWVIALIGLIAGGSLYWALREERWLEAFGIQKRIAELVKTLPPEEKDAVCSKASTQERLGELIETIDAHKHSR